MHLIASDCRRPHLRERWRLHRSVAIRAPRTTDPGDKKLMRQERSRLQQTLRQQQQGQLQQALSQQQRSRLRPKLTQQQTSRLQQVLRQQQRRSRQQQTLSRLRQQHRSRPQQMLRPPQRSRLQQKRRPSRSVECLRAVMCQSDARQSVEITASTVARSLQSSQCLLNNLYNDSAAFLNASTHLIIEFTTSTNMTPITKDAFDKFFFYKKQ
jgi:hypothetical protein